MLIPSRSASGVHAGELQNTNAPIHRCRFACADLHAPIRMRRFASADSHAPGRQPPATVTSLFRKWCRARTPVSKSRERVGLPASATAGLMRGDTKAYQPIDLSAGNQKRKDRKPATRRCVAYLPLDAHLPALHPEPLSWRVSCVPLDAHLPKLHPEPLTRYVSCVPPATRLPDLERPQCMEATASSAKPERQRFWGLRFRVSVDLPIPIQIRDAV